MPTHSHHNVRTRSIALAGLYQAASLVRLTATGRMRDSFALQATLASILVTDPESVDSVYIDLHHLRSGLETVRDQLARISTQRDITLTGIVIALLHLERKLAANPRMQEQLASGIAAVRQSGAQDAPEADRIAALAELYRQTISTLRPQIMVHGEPSILSNVEHQQMIRALLLAGIRAAVLWRQCGGSRWRLLFERRALLDSVRALLHTL